MANGNNLAEMYSQMWNNLFKLIALAQNLKEAQYQQQLLERQYATLGEQQRAHDIDTILEFIKLYGPGAFNIPGIKELTQKYGLTDLASITFQPPNITETLRRQLEYAKATANYFDIAKNRPLTEKEKQDFIAGKYSNPENVIEVPITLAGKWAEARVPDLAIKAEQQRAWLTAINMASNYQQIDEKTGERKPLSLSQQIDIAKMIQNGQDPSKKYPGLVKAPESQFDLINALGQTRTLPELLFNTEEGKFILYSYLENPKLKKIEIEFELMKNPPSGIDINLVKYILNRIEQEKDNFSEILKNYKNWLKETQKLSKNISKPQEQKQNITPQLPSTAQKITQNIGSYIPALMVAKSLSQAFEKTKKKK